MLNYRVTFGGDKIDYKSNFIDCRQYISIIDNILTILTLDGIKEKWWFFEPYVEITWLASTEKQGEKSLHDVTLFLRDLNILYKHLSPSDGQFADWYGLTSEEREWGAKRYNLVAQEALHFYMNNTLLNDGLGYENHFMRSCHVLANQLALNYKKEGILLIKRGILALLFWWLGHKKAVWIYEKILRQKYLGK